MSQVFESLYRNDLNVASPYIDIVFVKYYLKTRFEVQERHCAVDFFRNIMQILTNEHSQIDIVKSMFSPDHKNRDVISYHNNCRMNQFFGILMQKKVICPKKHITKICETT